MLTSNILQNKITLVTGANRGIGKGITKQFISQGATVFANARTEGSLNSLIEELPAEMQNRLIPVYCDINDSNAVKQVFLKIGKDFGQLDCLVNNAGIMKDALIGMVSKKLMQELFEVNVFATMDLLQYAAKLMTRKNAGSIINIASLVGIVGNPGQIAYAASKGAIIAMTKSAAKELASKKIRVNAIAPGIIATDLLCNVNQQIMDSITSKIGMKRLGNVEDVAGLAVFLASDFSNYITGQIIKVDGSTIM